MANLTGLFRLGRDAELRYTPSGDAVANLALAFNYGKKADNTSQWIDATIWGKRAEALAQYLVKGQQVFAVIDDPHIETYQKRDGGEGFKLTGRISNIEFAGARPQEAQGQRQQQAAPPQQQRQPAPQQRPANLADLDDSIPF
ncbi:single-stranded DNA-binding protein [Allopusillimonas ginsengisoli]|uniref:single-stranded DNA-binding protein n=1 Tax=Allopusillimonas ginsengisoli TaxID=453575 RepID=UPI0039C0196F